MAGEDDEILVVNSGGVVIRTSVREVSRQGRDATGVRIMNLSGDDVVAAVAPVIAVEDVVDEDVVDEDGADVAPGDGADADGEVVLEPDDGVSQDSEDVEHGDESDEIDDDPPSDI
jgi:DNA gyrase C-terminal domain, beta-propeller